MSHFAKIDNNNIVTEILVAEQDFINSGVVGDSFLWIQTSYNNNFRNMFAGVGYIYDPVKNVFYKPKQHASWTLNETTYLWEPPTAMPDDDKMYEWNETNQTWDEIT